jgi:predicted MFS family arabinose efflux permease
MTAGAVIPLSFAFVGDNVAYEGRQALLGRFIVGNLLGQTFGPLLGGVFSDSIGWRATFLVPAAAFFVIGLLLIPLARAEGAAQLYRTGGGNPVRRYVSLLRLQRVRIVLLAVALEGFLFFGTFAYLGAYLRHDFGLSYTAIGFILAGFGLGGVLYSVLVRVLLLRLGQHGLVGAGGVLLLVCFVVLALAASWAVCALAITIRRKRTLRGFGHPNKQDDCACNLDTRQGHRRTKDGVASLAYDPAIHLSCEEDGCPGRAWA